MPNAINRVACLHIPKLVSGNTAVLCWEAVENAVEYELEACFNTAFGDADATGKSWFSIESGDKTWSQMDLAEKNWQGIKSLPESHTIYYGAGTPGPSPDHGMTWAEQKSLDETWGTHNTKNLTWYDIKMLYTQGLAWDSVDAKFLSWGEIGQSPMLWQVLEQQGAHNSPHLNYEVDIPPNATWVVFRIRAFDLDGNTSSILYTSNIPVITSQHVNISPLETVLPLLVEGRQVNRKYATQYKLLYNNALVDVTPDKAMLQTDPTLTDELWSGMASAVQVRTKTKKDANVQLDWYKAN